MLTRATSGGLFVALAACTGSGPQPAGDGRAPAAPSAFDALSTSSASASVVASSLPEGLTPMPPGLAPSCRNAESEEQCAKGDGLFCWNLGSRLWSFCDPADDGAGATLFKRACELSNGHGEVRGYVRCWVAADLMATRVFPPHDTRDFAGSARLLAERCEAPDSPRDPRQLLDDDWEAHLPAICLGAAKASRSSGDPGWVDLAQRACAYDEAGCILAVDGLPLEQRYAALADRCESLLPKSFGGSGSEIDPKLAQRETIRFGSCYEAAKLYEGNKGKLKARSWTTEKSVAALILRAEDAGVKLDVDTLVRIPRARWPHDPASWKQEGPAPDPSLKPEVRVSSFRLTLCLRGEHALCDDDWLETRFEWATFDSMTQDMCTEPDKCRDGYCGHQLRFAPGMSCAYLASRTSETSSEKDPQEALKYARRGCWLDDWTCGVYAHILEQTGGPSGEIAFEYRRACDAGNAQACKAMKQ